jgi:hypothetical protein
MKTHSQRIIKYLSVILFLTVFVLKSTIGQTTTPADSSGNLRSNNKASHGKVFRMTSLTFGGNGVSFTRINNQFTVLTGGRGSATFNHLYTIGGGGWGMTKGVEVQSDIDGTYRFVKIGYGGIDVGYIFFPGETMNFGTKLLIAGGAVFKETVPKSTDKGFRMFPVLEPTAYYQIALGKLFKLEIGASYRFIWGTNLPYISDKNLSGFACYIGFLVKTSGCN